MPKVDLKPWGIRVRKVLVVSLVVPLLSILPVAQQPAFAAAIAATDGSCVQDVGSTSGVTVTRIGNDCIVQFTSTTSTTWKAPTGISNVRYLVVGGGASGDRGVCGVHWGHGGGGGQVLDSTLSVVAGTSYTVSVGAGGQGSANGVCTANATTVATTGFNGTQSQFGSIIASPGLRATTKSAVGGTSGAGFVGGTDTGTNPAGGGGGAGGIGVLRAGGVGVNSNITGETFMYGSGGAGRNDLGSGTASSGGATSTVAPIANRGGGGADINPGWYGGANGVVVLRYTDRFTVTFNSNGAVSGSATSSTLTQLSKDAAITLASRGTLANGNISFAGWNTQANGRGTNYAAGSSYTPTADITLFAQWNSVIQYDPNTATTTRAIESTTITTGSAQTTLSAGQLVKGSPISNGLVLHLDASDASTVSGSSWTNKVAGVAGAEASATLVGSPTYNASEGAFSLNGSSQFFTLGTTNYLFNGALPFTLNLSFKASDPNKDNCLIGNFNGGVGATHKFRLVDNVLVANRNVSPWQVAGTGQISAGEIVYASYSFDGSNMRVYLNGSLYATSALINSSVSYSGGTRIGACWDSNTSSRFFKGQIYNAQIYNRALSGAEITTNFDNLLPNRLASKNNFTLGAWNTQSNGTGTSFGGQGTDLAALPTPFFRVSAENYSGGTLSASVGGSNLSISKNGSPVLNTNSGGGFGANARFATISGATGDGFRLGNAELPNYTFCGMARYKDLDTGVRSTRNRIFSYGSGTNWLSGWYQGGTRSFFHNEWLLGPNSVADPNWHVVCDSGNRVFWDGVKQTVTQRAYTSLPPLAINWSGSSDNSHFEFTEAIVYNQALSDAEINSIFRYFKNKFGLTNVTTNALNATKFVPPTDYSSTGDTTLQATWVSQITYDGNNQASGSAPAPQVVTNAGATVATVGTLARSGFVFTGWNTAADGTGTRFAPGAALTNDGNKLLYAQWVLPVSLAAGAINPGTLNPYLRLVASDYDATTKVWRDSSGNSRNVTRVIGSPTLVTTTGNGATKSFQTVAGGTSDKFYFDNDPISTNWTVFALSRFSGANNRNRIISGNYASDAYQDSSGNWLFGQYGGMAAIAHYNGWVSPVSTPAGLNLTDWVMSTAYPSNYRYNGIARGTSGGTAELPPLGINTFTGQQSDYQVAEVIIFNRTLTLSEIRQIEDYFDERYGLSYSKVGIYQTSNTLAIGAGSGGRSETFTATNGLGTKTFSMSPSQSGMTLDTSTANSVVLVVSPVVATGTYTQTITATDLAGETSTHVVTVTVSPSVKFDTSTATTLITTHRKGTTLRLNTVFGVGTKVFTMTPAATGITLDTSTAAASGFATLRVDTFTATGTYTQLITVTDDTKIKSTYTVTITINAPPTISSTSAIVTSPVLDSLKFNLDAGDQASYTGSGTTWTDLSGNGKTGTWQQSPTFRTDNGGAIAIGSSTSQYMRSDGLGATNVLTAEAWVKFKVIPANDNCIVSDRYTDSFINLSICFRNDRKIYGGYWNGTNGWVSTAGTATPLINTWYHFVYTVSKSGNNFISILYQNGVAVGSPVSSTVSPGSSSVGFLVGTNWRQDGNVVNGDIAAVRVYGRALSSTEVLQNYNALLPRFSNNPSNVITITTTESVTASSSIYYAGFGTGNKTFSLSNPTAGISIDTSTVNTVRLNTATTLTATSTTSARTIAQVITATDTNGVAAATPVYVTTVVNPKIIVTDPTPGTLSTTFGRIAYDTFTATQGTETKTFTVSSASFGSAFVMTNPSANTGLLTVGNNLPAGTYPVTITATDRVGAVTTLALSVVVNPAPTIAGSPSNTLNTTVGRPASLRVNVIGGSGNRVITWTSPVAGISIDTSTVSAQNYLTVSVSNAVPTRTYAFSIAAVDSMSVRVADTFTVNVNNWPVIGSDGVVTNGLAANLDANTYSGSGAWADTSGFGRNATLGGAAPTGTSPTFSSDWGGNFGFAAGTHQIQFPNPGNLETFSVSTWVRIPQVTQTGNPAILGEYAASGNVNFIIQLLGGKIVGQYRVGSTWSPEMAGFVPEVNKWMYITYVVSKLGTNSYMQTLYKDGVSVSTLASTLVPARNGANGGVILLGRRWDTTHSMTGNIASVAVYNRAITAAEVAQNYNATGSRFISTNSGRETVTVTQGIAGSISGVSATQGTGTKSFAITNASAAVTIDTSIANSFTLNLANTLTSTSTTVARTITETVTATDAAGATTARVYSIVVNPPVRVESTTSTITTTSGIVAWDTFTATQGTGLKTFTLTGTPSTTGFTLTQANSQAVLRVGETVNPGTYTLSLVATDSLGAQTTLLKTVVVNAPPTITGNVSFAGTTGFAFTSPSYTSANGTGTRTFSISVTPATAGRNVSGITLSSTTGSPTINVTSGTLADTYTITLRVADSLTAFATMVVTLRVNSPITLSGALTLSKVYGEELSQVYTTGGGTAPFSIFSSNLCTTEKSTYVGNGTNGTSGVTYTVERFNGVGTCDWVVPTSVNSANVLVVGGGGAGGTVSSGSSGGGGGGQVVSSNPSLTAGSSLQVTVGAGGIPTTISSAASTSNPSGGNGGTSSLVPNGGSAISALGGGGGANSRIYNVAQGVGSTTGWTGGGGSSHASTASDGSTGVGLASVKGGNAHADGNFANPQAGGGGGGAGGVGQNAKNNDSNGAAGAGGPGVESQITSSSVFYGGGGGGGKRNAVGTAGSASGGGGRGGGGLNATQSGGFAGSANTGGGGGGGGEIGQDPWGSLGGRGGSGTVIVRYVTPAVDSETTRITLDALTSTPTGSLRLNAPKNLPVGTYTQTITVTDATGSTGSTPVTVTLTVAKATPTLALSLPGSVTTTKYGSPVTISATSPIPGRVAFVNGSDTITACASVLASSGLATCSWTPTVVGATTLRAILTPTDTANYNSSALVNLAITVAKADTLTVTVASLTRQFTGSAVSVTGAFTTSGLVAIDSLTAISMLYSGTANTGVFRSATTAPTDAGIYTIAPNFPANASAYTFVAGSLGTTSSLSNYESVTVVAGTLTINRAPQVLSFTYPNSNTATYSPTGTITASATTRLDSAVRSYSSTTLTKCTIDSSTALISIVEAGSCQVNMVVAQTFNYLADTATAAVTINKASRTFVLTPAVSTLKFADTTTVTATLSAGAADGTISYILGSPAGCTFDPLSGELLAISGTVQCPLTATISEGINYLAETTTAMSLTISRANAPTITIDTITAMDHTPGIRALITPSYSVTGLKNTDTADSLTFTYGFVSNPFETFTYSDTRTPIDAGTYSITPSALTLSSGLMSNYETPTYSASAINFVINRIAQETVTIQSVNGEVDVPFNLIATGGSTSQALSFTRVSGDFCSVSGTTLTSTQAGACVVTVTRAGDRNYLAFTSASVTVRVRNFVVVVVVVPSNPVTGITIAPSTPPLTKAPDSNACITGCVPSITSIDVLAAAEGELVIITGLSFNQVNKVYFRLDTFSPTDDVEAPNFAVDSDTQISVRVPADLVVGEFYTIRVATPDKTSARFYDIEIAP